MVRPEPRAARASVSLAVDEGEVVGVAAMSFFRTRLDGVETRLAIPVHVATDARYRGQGVFSTLEHANEDAAADSGSPLTVTFPNARLVPDLRRPARLDRPAAPAAVGAAAARVRGRALRRSAARASGRRSARRARPADFSAASRCARRALRGRSRRARPARRGRLREPLRARRRVPQLALPRLAARLPLLRRIPRRRARGRRGRRVTRQARRLGRDSSPISSPVRRTRRRCALSRPCARGGRGGADARRALPPPSPAQRRALAPVGFAPTSTRAALHRQAAPRRCPVDETPTPGTSALGDLDFF